MKNSKPHGSSTSLVLTTLALALAGALTACGGGDKSAEAKSAEKAASYSRHLYDIIAGVMTLDAWRDIEKMKI